MQKEARRTKEPTCSGAEQEGLCGPAHGRAGLGFTDGGSKNSPWPVPPLHSKE